MDMGDGAAATTAATGVGKPLTLDMAASSLDSSSFDYSAIFEGSTYQANLRRGTRHDAHGCASESSGRSEPQSNASFGGWGHEVAEGNHSRS